jgi:eukaryotic-like serine/threonine-protein kinase
MPATTDIHRGDVLAERYRVGRRVGSGGMAAVYKADDVVLDREVAVKRVHSDGTESDSRRLRREAKLGASLTHPNLVMVYDTITADDGVFIVMEHVDGRPLSELIGAEGMPPGEAIPILRALADALDYAHRNGIAHRDVKPANVLIGDDGQVKLVDLGAAIGAGATRVTQTHEVIGTLSYLPPERLSGESAGEAAGDIYSLAVLAFVTLTGVEPRDAVSPAEHLTRIAAGPPDLRARWPEIPPALEVALERGMDPDPDRRQQTATELVDEIDAGLAPAIEPTQAIPAPVVEPFEPAAAAGSTRTSPPWSRRAAAATLAGCALAVVAIVLAATGGGGSQPVALDRQASASGHHAASSGGKDSSKAAPPATTTTVVTTTTTTTPAAASEPAPAPSSSGEELNNRGFALIGKGDYAAAIPVLRRAVDELKSDPSSLTYAYALFNLGHALRLAGQPEAAIPILEQRLQIPNQTATVQAELDAARAAAGKTPPKDSPPHGRAVGHDKHGGPPPGDEGD